MKTSGIWAAAALLGTAVSSHSPCLAGEGGRSANILGPLAGTAVPPAELMSQHGRGLGNINIETNYTRNVDNNFNFDGSLSNGTLRGNAVIGTSDTGMISTTGSINNNTGITTVFQNSGNNSLFQQSTSIFITVH